MNSRIKIVISGSFRKHLDDIGIALTKFKKLGAKVIAPLTAEVINRKDDFIFLMTDDSKKYADVLEKEFMTNILKADFLCVLNVGGYIGKSVAAELGVAVMNGIPVVVSEEIKKFSTKIPKTAQEFLKKSIFNKLPVNEISSQKITELNLQNFSSVNLSLEKRALLQSLVEKLLNDLKFVRIGI